MLTTYTLIRVVALMALATIVWVPISVWIGLRPRWAEAVQPIAQFLAAFPVNLLFGAAVSLVLAFHLNPNIWLSFLIVFGTQWYIVFNTIGGAAAFPNDLREAVANFRIRGWRWWRQVIIPARRALLSDRRDHRLRRIVERLDRRRIRRDGRTIRLSPRASAPISPRLPKKATSRKSCSGVAVMSVFVTLFNRLFWRQLYAYAERRLRL